MVELIIKRNRERNQKILINTVCTMICFAPIDHFVNQLCRLMFGTGFSLDTLLCYGVLTFMILASLKQLHFHIKIDVLLVMLVFAVFYAISYSFGDNNKRYMFTEWTDFAGNPLYLLFAFTLPAYVFMRYITDYDRLFETCRVFSLIAVFCSLGSFVLMLIRNSQPEYMNFSYNLVFATIFSLIYFFEKRKLVPLIAAIIGGVLIFLAGARGPLVCIIFSLIVYFLISKASVAKKMFLVFFLLTAGLIIMLMWEPLLTSLKDAADEVGISLRTVDLLIEGEFSSDSGRWGIQQEIMEGFTLLGSGLYGDRVLGGNHYAHNLIIELIAQWGYLFGAILFALLGILFFRGFRTKNSSLQMLILVFFSSGFVKLMFSGSYLAYNAIFFVLIAACVNAFEAEEAMPLAAPAESQKKKSKYIKTAGRYI